MWKGPKVLDLEPKVLPSNPVCVTYVSLDELFNILELLFSVKCGQPHRVNTECLRGFQVVNYHNNIIFPWFQASYHPSIYFIGKRQVDMAPTVKLQYGMWLVIGCRKKKVFIRCILGSLKVHEILNLYLFSLQPKSVTGPICLWGINQLKIFVLHEKSIK